MSQSHVGEMDNMEHALVDVVGVISHHLSLITYLSCKFILEYFDAAEFLDSW
jgi:hypothetical protein